MAEINTAKTTFNHSLGKGIGFYDRLEREQREFEDSLVYKGSAEVARERGAGGFQTSDFLTALLAATLFLILIAIFS